MQRGLFRSYKNCLLCDTVILEMQSFKKQVGVFPGEYLLVDDFSLKGNFLRHEAFSKYMIKDLRELFLALMFLLSKLAYAVCTVSYADVKKMIHLSLLPVTIVRINTVQTGRLQF